MVRRQGGEQIGSLLFYFVWRGLYFYISHVGFFFLGGGLLLPFDFGGLEMFRGLCLGLAMEYEVGGQLCFVGFYILVLVVFGNAMLRASRAR
jgi:hypothetical protein